MNLVCPKCGAYVLVQARLMQGGSLKAELEFGLMDLEALADAADEEDPPFWVNQRFWQDLLHELKTTPCSKCGVVPVIRGREAERELEV